MKEDAKCFFTAPHPRGVRTGSVVSLESGTRRGCVGCGDEGATALALVDQSESLAFRALYRWSDVRTKDDDFPPAACIPS